MLLKPADHVDEIFNLTSKVIMGCPHDSLEAIMGHPTSPFVQQWDVP